jgi:hypothetical protein
LDIFIRIVYPAIFWYLHEFRSCYMFFIDDWNQLLHVFLYIIQGNWHCHKIRWPNSNLKYSSHNQFIQYSENIDLESTDGYILKKILNLVHCLENSSNGLTCYNINSYCNFYGECQQYFITLTFRFFGWI